MLLLCLWVAVGSIPNYIFGFVFSIQNGYAGRSRNLVDDAKFESRVHDEEKQNIINAVKRQSTIQITGEFLLSLL